MRSAVRTLSVPVETTESAQGRSRPAWASAGGAVVGLSALIHLALCWLLRGFTTDDAWISVRYAENLAAGYGFVWNPGGPRVEGASNPLLVAVEALVSAAGWSAPGAARVLGVAGGLACVVLVYVMGRPVVGEYAARIASLLTACSAPFALWAVGGLETLLVALAVTVGTLEVARPDGGRLWRAAPVLAVLPWLRPEGIAVAAALVAFGEARGVFRAATRRRALFRVAVLGGVPVCSQIVLEVVRLGIYGHLLPNSVLYKSGAGEGWTVLAKFLDQAWLPSALAAVGALLMTGRGRLLAVPPLVYVAGSIGTLDSANAYSRFFQPVWPLVALLAAVVVGRVASSIPRGGGRVGAAVLGAAAGAVLLVLPPGDVRSVHDMQERYMDCRVGARESALAWLRTTPGDTSFAISDAGLVPARAEGRPVVDDFFLNEPLIQKTGRLSPGQRAELVHRRSPDVLVLASRDARRFVGAYPTEQAIYEHPAMSDYFLAHVARGRGAGCHYNLMVFAR
jgi:arabinofuranosyltransferase